MEHENWQSRTEILLGKEAVATLHEASVTVIGLGGVGGIAAEMIARAGVGKMILIDADRFDSTNRNRQIGALDSTTGKSKVAAMTERLKDINPDIEITGYEMFITPEMFDAEPDKIPDFLKTGCVLDAIDSVGSKTALLASCVRNSVPVVSSMGSGARLDPEKVRCADISKTEYCRLAKAVRQQLKKRGIEKGVCCIFSPETPVCSNSDAIGTISYMPNVFGCHCAAAVLKKLLKRDS